MSGLKMHKFYVMDARFKLNPIISIALRVIRLTLLENNRLHQDHENSTINRTDDVSYRRFLIS